MAGKAQTFAGDILKLIFLGTAITGLAQNHATPLTQLWVSLHTADPGETPASGQATSEVAYTGYARVAVARGAGAFSVTDDVLSLIVDVLFGKCTAGTATATHVSFGTDATGTGKILYSGPISPITIAANVRPIIEAGSTITEG